MYIDLDWLYELIAKSLGFDGGLCMNEYYFNIDERFLNYMKNIKQVFLYVVDKCNLDCEQCLYKPNNYFYLSRQSIPLEEAKKLLHDFYFMGARKLTIMGGEPTLYGIEEEWKPLLSLISYAKELGYQYVRIDTNGTLLQKLLYKDEFKLLDEITFSLDGPSAEINDAIRGKGVFDKCIDNIKTAKELGYKCDITCCIHKGLMERDENHILYFERMIRFAEEIGIDSINFHDLFKSYIPRDTWSGNIGIDMESWHNIWAEIYYLITHNKYNISIRVPQGVSTVEKFSNNPTYYGYCSAKVGDRILVHPDGILRICSLMIGTPYGIAKYYDNKIMWDEGYTNELNDQEIEKLTPCAHQYKNRDRSLFIPLCVSFKPLQDEFVWNDLRWETKKQKG